MIKPPLELKCEYLENPIQIDTIVPRFSWIVKHEERNQSQSAYRIILSTDETSISSEKGKESKWITLHALRVLKCFYS